MIHSCCFTGHRKVPEEEKILIMRRLYKRICRLAENGCVIFNVGGALGFDTIAADMVLRAKKLYPKLQLHLYRPYPNQTEKWPESDRAYYELIKSKTDKVFYSADRYSLSAISARNRRLVDNSDYCIAYCKKATGGTAYTLNYAIDMGVDFENLAMEIG